MLPVEIAGKNLVMRWRFREAFWDGAESLDLEAPGCESWSCCFTSCVTLDMTLHPNVSYTFVN